MTPTLAGHPSGNKARPCGKTSHSWQALALFVGLLCTSAADRAALAADASLTPIATITKAMVNNEVTVEATISEIREPINPRAPYNIMLTQDGATLPLIFWSDTLSQLGSKVKVGNVVRVTASVNLYREILQLRLRVPTSLIVVSEAAGGVALTAPVAPPAAPAAPAASPTATVIGAIKVDWADRIVIVSGTIASTESVDKTQKLAVQDATGEIQVVLGEKALSGVSVAQLQPGRVVTVTGPVKFDNGTRQIIPDTAGAMKFGP